MDVIVYCRPGSPMGRGCWGDRDFPCLIGKNGPVEAEAKREGDGCTPLGRWPLLLGFYRADRTLRPKSKLPWRATQAGDAFCDEPTDPLYNHLVWPEHPSEATGTLWKAGHEYDVVLSLGYNVVPIVPGRGSAILLHGWRDGAAHTGGCVALPNLDLLWLADRFVRGDAVVVMIG